MMSFGKKILFFLFIVLWIPVFTAGAQEAQTAAADAGEEDSDSIMTVEEAYLSSAEGVIIKELAQSGGRDGKQVALHPIQEIVYVALFLDGDNALYGRLQQVAVMTHILSITCFLVELLAKRFIWFRLILAGITHLVKQFFGRQMVADNGSGMRKINHIERMQQIGTVDVHTIVLVL